MTHYFYSVLLPILTVCFSVWAVTLCEGMVRR